MIDLIDQEYYMVDREYGAGLVTDYALNFRDFTVDLTLVCSGKVVDRKFGIHIEDIKKVESKFITKESAQEDYPEWFV